MSEKISTPYGVFDSVWDCTEYIMNNPEALADFTKKYGHRIIVGQAPDSTIDADIAAMDKAGMFDIH